MNIIYNIGIYMLTSSLIMVSYVWFRYKQHTHSARYKQLLEDNDHNLSEETHYAEKILAA